MNTVLLKFTAGTILLGLTTFTFADLIEQRPVAAADHLGDLARAVQGGYEVPKLNANVRDESVVVIDNAYHDRKNAQSNETTQEQDDDLIYVSNELLSKYQIKKIYPDSDVVFDKQEKDYWEIKSFNNNVLMLRIMNADIAYFIYDHEELDDSWYIKCGKDHITDEKSCFLSKFNFVIVKSSKHGLNLMVSYEVDKLNYRASHYIRVDQNKAWKTNDIFTGNSALNIINQMQKGQYAYTRFTEWSNQYEETLPLFGFTAAYQTMLKMYAGL